MYYFKMYQTLPEVLQGHCPHIWMNKEVEGI